MKTLVLPMNQASYELSLRSYALGKADYFRLKDSRQQLIDGKKSYWGGIEDQVKRFTQIVMLVGCDFRNAGGPYACSSKN